MKQKFLDLYMEIAEVAAKTSSATRLKVGAVAVKDHRILSIGYNGTPPGFDNECEEKVWVSDEGPSGGWTTKTRLEVIHAEQNAIYKMARDGQSALDADLFVTHAPCIECAKAIKTSGFRKVWYRNQYRSDDGIKFLQQLGVEVEKI